MSISWYTTAALCDADFKSTYYHSRAEQDFSDKEELTPEQHTAWLSSLWVWIWTLVLCALLLEIKLTVCFSVVLGLIAILGGIHEA